MWNPNTEMSEDCLHLNIWVPFTQKGMAEHLPVMVWIFGGGFYSGSNTLDLYDGKVLAATENVVVISINYRVNAFGFLYLGEEYIPGNMGLYDQQFALKWIQENIRYFGGDASRVTLFGESAGASSVAFHMLNPENIGLFHNAIMQSSSALAPWGFVTKEEALRRSQKLARQLGCLRTDATGIEIGIAMKCLKAIPAESITAHEFVVSGFSNFSFVPVIDSDFIPGDPWELLKQNNALKNVNVLYGNNKNEGNYFIAYFLTEQYKTDQLLKPGKSEFVMDEESFEKGAIALQPYSFRRKPCLTDAIIHEYKPMHPQITPLKYQDSLDKLGGDLQFTCPVIAAADMT